MAHDQLCYTNGYPAIQYYIILDPRQFGCSVFRPTQLASRKYFTFTVYILTLVRPDLPFSLDVFVHGSTGQWVITT